MAISRLFSSHDNDESESTAEGDPRSRDSDEDEEQQLTVGAGVASATVGFLFGGPFTALLLGFGAAYATQKPPGTAVGDSARAVGQVARTAQLQACEINRKHDLVGKSQQLARQAWQQARTLDERHRVLDQGKDFLQYSWNTTTEFCQRHCVVERSVQGANQALGWAAQQLDQRTGTRIDNGDGDQRGGGATTSATQRQSRRS